MKRIFGQGGVKWFLGTILAFMAGSMAASAQQTAVLAWNPSPNSSTTGYYIYYGTTSGDYTAVLDAGTNTTFAVPNLQADTTYYFSVSSYTANGTQSVLSSEVSFTTAPISLIAGGVDLGNNIEYLSFPDGNVFGYYSDAALPWIYHFDMGYEYLIDAGDAQGGAFMYDNSSRTFMYTNPALFPYLYNFTLKAWLYYYPNTQNPGHYTSNPRYFYDFSSSKIITL